MFGSRKESYSKATADFPDARASELAVCTRLLGDLTPGSRLLEIGSGTGYLTRHLSEKGYVVDAIDSEFECPVGCSLFWQRDVRAGLPDELRAGVYSAVVSLAAMHHIAASGSHAPPQRFIDGVRRALVPAGSVVILDVADPHDTSCGLHAECLRTGRFFREVVDVFTVPAHDGRYLRIGPTCSCLKRAGFENVVSGDIPCYWRFRSVDSATVFVQRLFGLQGLTKRRVADALHDIVGVNVEEDGCLTLRWALQCFVAHAPSSRSQRTG